MDRVEVRTRFAPSPTGFLHIGGLRTALFEFLWAKKNNGKFILRIEDTDQARNVPGALENIVQTLTDFKLNPDEGFYWDGVVLEKGDRGPYLQSKRLGLYKKYAEDLVNRGNAYYCFCSQERLTALRSEQTAKKIPPKYDKLCLKLTKEEIQNKIKNNEPKVIRLNVPPNQQIRFTDLVHGQIEISTNDLDDQVLLKSDSFPTYHLAVVVDDYLMGVNYVIRGEEWIPSTPKHILIYSSFGWELPKFAHLPLLLSKSRKKLSKREGDVAVKDFLEQGYLPEALLNFVALLGWNPKTEQEKFTLDELIEEFSFEKLNKSGAVFDLEKLDWLNGVYIRELKIEELHLRLLPYLTETFTEFKKYPKEFLFKIIALEQGRLKKLSEIGERVRYFFSEPEFNPELLRWKKMNNEEIKQSLSDAKKIISNFEFQISKQEIEKKFLDELTGKDKGSMLWPLRIALTGLKASPGPFEIMEAFGVLPNGREIILSRIKKALSRFR